MERNSSFFNHFMVYVSEVSELMIEKPMKVRYSRALTQLLVCLVCRELLDAYAACKDGAEVIVVQNEFLTNEGTDAEPPLGSPGMKKKIKLN